MLFSAELKKEKERVLNSKGYLTVEQYAQEQGITPWYVRKICRNPELRKKRKLNCKKMSHMWVIEI